MKTHQNARAQDRDETEQEHQDSKRRPERKQADLRIKQQRQQKVRYAVG